MERSGRAALRRRGEPAARGDLDNAPAPALAAALLHLELADLRLRPWWAAHWVAQGLGGECLAELAGLRGDDVEVSDMWPDAMRELGVPHPAVGARRTTAPWCAQQVVSGRRDVRWLLRSVWPSVDGVDDDELDTVLYSLDELVDLAGRRGLAPDERQRWRELADGVVAAMAADGVRAAGAVLDEGVPGERTSG